MNRCLSGLGLRHHVPGVLVFTREANRLQIGNRADLPRPTFKSQSHMHKDVAPLFTVAIATAALL